jgi:hypothetical protein
MHHLLQFSYIFQKLNVRCNPQDVIITIKILNERQRQAVERKGFSNILDMTLDALGSRSHLPWLMNKLDHKNMIIRPGQDKELKITKEIVHLILGLPNAGGGKPLGIDVAVVGSDSPTSFRRRSPPLVVGNIVPPPTSVLRKSFFVRCHLLSVPDLPTLRRRDCKAVVGNTSTLWSFSSFRILVSCPNYMVNLGYDVIYSEQTKTEGSM